MYYHAIATRPTMCGTLWEVRIDKWYIVVRLVTRTSKKTHHVLIRLINGDNVFALLEDRRGRPQNKVRAHRSSSEILRVPKCFIKIHVATSNSVLLVRVLRTADATSTGAMAARECDASVCARACLCVLRIHHHYTTSNGEINAFKVRKENCNIRPNIRVENVSGFYSVTRLKRLWSLSFKITVNSVKIGYPFEILKGPLTKENFKQGRKVLGEN